MPDIWKDACEGARDVHMRRLKQVMDTVLKVTVFRQVSEGENLGLLCA
jgi:hypothetical protein